MTGSPGTAAGSAAPLAPRRRTINRYEVKYFTPTVLVPRLLDELRGFVAEDPQGTAGRGYAVFSIYWDTDDWRFFWEKVEGVNQRRKLRFRRYGDAADVFVEVKEREDRTLHKRRLKWPLERVLASFEAGAGRIAWDGLDDPVAVEAALMIDRWRLKPTIGVRYRRLAFHGAFDPELRITVDSRIQYRTAPLSLADPFDSGPYVLDPRMSVLEIKYDHRAPKWLIKLVGRHGLKIVRMSKYCSAVDRHLFGGQNT